MWGIRLRAKNGGRNLLRDTETDFATSVAISSESNDGPPFEFNSDGPPSEFGSDGGWRRLRSLIRSMFPLDWMGSTPRKKPDSMPDSKPKTGLDSN